jgi:hypothetical protein
MNKPTTEEVAREFAQLIRAYLSDDELAEVNDLNDQETDPNVCHSHDFCDANDAMLGAFQKFGLEVDNEANHPLWCDAWDLAVKNHFWVLEN